MAEFDPVAMLRTLDRHGVRFVLIGGVAAVIRGAPAVTADVDITPATGDDNLRRLAEALADMEARLRTVADPDGVPFPLTAEMLATSSTWTLVTSHGDLDLMFGPSGTGGYPDLAADATVEVVAEDPPLEVVVASLADVIRSKEAAGRDKDRAVLPLLRRTLGEAAGDG